MSKKPMPYWLESICEALMVIFVLAILCAPFAWVLYDLGEHRAAEYRAEQLQQVKP